MEPVNSRDLFNRVVYGSRISLLIAFFATMLSVLLGTTAGIVAGFFGGWVDAFISRLMDIFLAFPLLVFAIALAGVIPDEAFGLRGNSLRIIVAGVHHRVSFQLALYRPDHPRPGAVAYEARVWPTRARSLGARRPYLLMTEMLPNLVAPILVYALLIPTNILFEAAVLPRRRHRPPTATGAACSPTRWPSTMPFIWHPVSRSS